MTKQKLAKWLPLLIVLALAYLIGWGWPQTIALLMLVRFFVYLWRKADRLSRSSEVSGVGAGDENDPPGQDDTAKPLVVLRRKEFERMARDRNVSVDEETLNFVQWHLAFDVPEEWTNDEVIAAYERSRKDST